MSLTINHSTPQLNQTSFKNKKDQQLEKHTLGSRVLGFLASDMAAGAVLSIKKPISKNIIMPRFLEQGQMSEADTKFLQDTLNKCIEDNGLKAKGVTVKLLEPLENGKNIIKYIKKEINEKIKNKKTISFKDIKNYMMDCATASIRAGENACFLPNNAEIINENLTNRILINKNTILLPKNALANSGFHEMGHALNQNTGLLGKMLVQSRRLAPIGALIAAYGMLSTTSKNKDGSTDNLTTPQKLNNFIRNNAGKLAFAFSMPVVIEEGLASIRGQQYAKKLLSPELYKRVVRGNAFGFLTYLSSAVFTGLAAWTAVKVKDACLTPKK